MVTEMGHVKMPWQIQGFSMLKQILVALQMVGQLQKFLLSLLVWGEFNNISIKKGKLIWWQMWELHYSGSCFP